MTAGTHEQGFWPPARVALARTLLEQDSVLVQPGYFFDLAMGATLVFSLIVEEQVFAEGVARLLARVAAM